MLRRIWQSIVRFFQRLFGSKRNSAASLVEKQPPPPLTDTDYEFLFSQLLEGVAHGWQQPRVMRFFETLGERGETELWVAWLRRFGERVLASSAPNNELGMRMIQLGELDCGEISNVAYEIGTQLLTRESKGTVWDYQGPDANTNILPSPDGLENPQEFQTITLDELFVKLQQDSNLVQQMAEQLGIDSVEPQVIIDALIDQFNAANPETTTETTTPPASAVDWFNRGNELLGAQNWQGAIAAYDQALQLEPRLQEAWTNRGFVFQNLQRYTEALASFERALELNPNSYKAWNNKANALNGLDRLEEALAAYDQAIELHPDYYEAWNNRAYILRRLGRYEEALASYDKATAINPEIEDAWNNRGYLLEELGRLAEANESFLKGQYRGLSR